VLELTRSGNARPYGPARGGIDKKEVIKELEALKEIGHTTETLKDGEKRYQLLCQEGSA
jgi:tRNA U34 5-carboxymethylaminomethyl modifying enzyme MnmG/GidA